MIRSELIFPQQVAEINSWVFQMNRLDSNRYIAELDCACHQALPWEKLAGKTLAISGATGMIGSFLIDVIMRKNATEQLGCHILAIGRSEKKAHARLPYFDNALFEFEELDVSLKGTMPSIQSDYVLHLASSTHPRQYASNPVGTICANVDGLHNLLEYSTKYNAKLLFASSVEVYGENRGDVERFDEEYCGYIDCNTLRACYTESKRLGEAMCQAYRAQKSVETVIARIARVYGPTLLPDDSKALSQFIHRALLHQNVVLKSDGMQQYSFLYVADAVTGLLCALLLGEDGEAYNLADPSSDVTLRKLATAVASIGGVEVEFEKPDAEEAAGYSKASIALMDGGKMKHLGWSPLKGIYEGLTETLAILRSLEAE